MEQPRCVSPVLTLDREFCLNQAVKADGSRGIAGRNIAARRDAGGRRCEHAKRLVDAGAGQECFFLADRELVAEARCAGSMSITFGQLKRARTTRTLQR